MPSNHDSSKDHVEGTELWDAFDPQIASDLTAWAVAKDLGTLQLAGAAISIMALNLRKVECEGCRMALIGQHLKFFESWLNSAKTPPHLMN